MFEQPMLQKKQPILWRQAQYGFTQTEMLITIGLIGLAMVIIVPSIFMLTQNSNMDGDKHEHYASQIVKIYQSEKSSKGLLPRNINLSAIADSKLNYDSKRTLTQAQQNSVAQSCQATVRFPAEEYVMDKGNYRIYIPHSWTLNPITRNDTMLACVSMNQQNNTEVARTVEITREGEQMGTLVNANGGNNRPIGPSNGSVGSSGPTTGTAQNGGTATGNISWVTVTPTFVSMHDGQPLQIQEYNLLHECVSGTNGQTQGSVLIPAGDNCTFNMTLPWSAANGSPQRIIYVNNNGINLNINPGAQPVFQINDQYRVTISAQTPASARAINVQDKVTIDFAGQQYVSRTNHTASITTYIPSGQHGVSVKSSSSSRVNDTIAVNRAEAIRNYQLQMNGRVNIMATGLGADGNFGTGSGVSNFANILQNLWAFRDGSYGQTLQAILANPNHANYAAALEQWNALMGHIANVPVWAANYGLQAVVQADVPTLASQFGSLGHLMAISGGQRQDGTFIHDRWNFFAKMTHEGQVHQNFMGARDLQYGIDSNGQFFGYGACIDEPNETCTYDVDIDTLTPVKINLQGEHATLNSDDSFEMDLDGFASNKITRTLITPGGLNASEAWLILDRDNDGTWKNNALDNNDLFGDHLGQVANGYVDLANTFRHELKTDAKGKRYIDLREHSWWGEIQLGFARTFMGDKVPYAAYDLKLLTRDRRLIPANTVLSKIYVDYQDVKEYDNIMRNAIYQRSWVQFADGRFAQSADQYFLFPTGSLRVYSAAESKERLRHMKPVKSLNELTPKSALKKIDSAVENVTKKASHTPIPNLQ